MLLSAEDGRSILGMKDDVVRFFTAANWNELGLLTGCGDVVNGHSRLLRSLSFHDDDYAGCVLDVLQRIVSRDPGNLATITDYVARTDPTGGQMVSSAPTRGPRIVFSPNAFDVPDGGVDSKLIAVMMPFSTEFEPVFEAIKKACYDNGLTCLRVKDIWESSAIIQDVFSLIFRANVVVCDFSGRNPNVFYEAGIAHTLGKHVIPLSQSKDDVPFDVSHHRYLPYLNNGEGLVALSKALQKRLTTLTGDDALTALLG